MYLGVCISPSPSLLRPHKCITDRKAPLEHYANKIIAAQIRVANHRNETNAIRPDSFLFHHRQGRDNGKGHATKEVNLERTAATSPSSPSSSDGSPPQTNSISPPRLPALRSCGEAFFAGLTPTTVTVPELGLFGSTAVTWRLFEHDSFLDRR